VQEVKGVCHREYPFAKLLEVDGKVIYVCGIEFATDIENRGLFQNKEHFRPEGSRKVLLMDFLL
jgi:hypothetical protein